uniref:Tps26 n=1 Tax=Arundo donax TaxID=35708 RepID=A0A0A9F681_ARUDO
MKIAATDIGMLNLS